MSIDVSRLFDSAGTTRLNIVSIDLSPNNSGSLLPVNQIMLSNTAQVFWKFEAISMTSNLAVGQGIILNGMLLLPGLVLTLCLGSRGWV